MKGLGLISLVVYTFGAFSYGTILILWATQAQQPGWASRHVTPSRPGRELAAVNGALLVVSFLWFCCNVALVLFGLLPVRAPWPLTAIAIFLAFLFPPIVMHLTRAEIAQSDADATPAAWRAALWPAYAAALAIPLWSMRLLLEPSIAQPGGAERLLGAGLSVSFVIAAVYSMALIWRYGQAREARGRQPRHSLLGLFGLMVLLFLVLLAITLYTGEGHVTSVAGAWVETAAKSLPLVFMFVGTYHENRFQFFDLFMKRGAAMVITLAVLTASFAAALPVLGTVTQNSAAPWIFAVSLLPIVVGLSWLNSVVARFLDRHWLGRRYSTVDAVRHFLGSLQAATTEAQLVAGARTGLQEIFDAATMVVVGETAAGRMQDAQEIPIKSGDRVVGRFLMGPRAGEAPYFSEDLALLTALARVFASLLENVHLQERKLHEEQRAREMSLHASRSELKALRAQINPHFLFNALNSIAGLIHREPAVADRTIEQLADVFRYALRGAESEWTVLDDELEFVRAYLDVERARFGERLHTDVRLDAGARGARVPTMVVQTLVENAVKHGAAAVRGRASVDVSARSEAGRLIVSVADNGPGFHEPPPSSPRTQGGYGLLNIRQRLDGYFGRDAALAIARDEALGTTTVSVSMPLLRQEPRSAAVLEQAR